MAPVCTDLQAPESTATKAKPQVQDNGAVGGMPYSLPMALLQMEADPGSLTAFSHAAVGCDADIRAPLAASTLQVWPQLIGPVRT